MLFGLDYIKHRLTQRQNGGLNSTRKWTNYRQKAIILIVKDTNEVNENIALFLSSETCQLNRVFLTLSNFFLRYFNMQSWKDKKVAKL